jgi:iron complex transport system permease protein
MQRLDSLKMGYHCTDLRLRQEYLSSIRKRLLLGGTLFGCVLVVFVSAISIGSLNLSLSETIRAALHESEFSYVLWNLRIPRAIGAILAGASLGVAGAVMQNVLRNPLASPFTLGVSHGAAFGAAFAIIVLGAGQTHSYGTEAVTVFKSYPVVISAFLGSLLTVVVILLLSFLKGVLPEAIILAGVALSSLFGAMTMFFQYFASDFQVAATLFWTFGDIGKAGWLENKYMFVAFSLCFIYFFFQRWNFNALLWGDDVAKSLGVNVKFMRISAMFFSALMVSICTAFLGIIGFVGLISPHIIRLICGNDYRFLIPLSAIFGALLLLISDLIARTILAPAVLPVGIVTSFAGAPIFFFLLIRHRRF